MKLNKLWVLDPANKNKPSVSLTLMIISIILLIIVGIMQVLGKVQSTGPFLEFTYSAIALYFGRRFTFKGQSYSSAKAEEVEEFLEDQK